MRVIGCRIDLADVADVKHCLDPSLPEGHAFWVATHSQPQGHFFLSGTNSTTTSIVNFNMSFAKIDEISSTGEVWNRSGTTSAATC